MVSTRRELMPDMWQAVEQKTITEVWLEGASAPTPVTPSELFHSDEYGFCIQEYVDDAGGVRVSNLFVLQGATSPKWHIKPDAGDGRYVEEQIVMSGKGWLRLFDAAGNILAEHVLDAGNIDGSQFPVEIHPGEIFQVEAAAEQDERLRAVGLVGGVMVCAVLRRVPFDIDFEEKVK